MNTPQHQIPQGAGPAYPDDMIQQEQQSIYRDPTAPELNDYGGEEYHNPNPRKRGNTDNNENPKKRAAVAVSDFRNPSIILAISSTLTPDSAIFVAAESRSAMVVNHAVDCVPNSTRSASTRSRESSLTQVTE